MNPMMPFPYGDVSQFKDLIGSIDTLKGHINSINEFLEPLLDPEFYNKLDLEEKLERDLFMSYAFSSLFWIYMRTTGQNPATSRVKAEIERVKEHRKRYKLLKERKTMPRLDKEAADRFVRSGLWTPGGNIIHKRKRKRDEEETE